LGDTSLRHLPGGVDQYLELRKHSLSATKIQNGKALAPSGTKPQPTGLSGAALRDAQKNLARIERALEKLGIEEVNLHEQMASQDQNDYAALSDLANKQAACNLKREQLETEWLEASDLLNAK
jgi:hypothetical protein